MAEFGTPMEIIPAPDGEGNTAYNAAVIQSLNNELVGPVERDRMQKLLWLRLLVNGLIQRIANLRALHKRAHANGYAAGLEAAAKVQPDGPWNAIHLEAIEAYRKTIRALSKKEKENAPKTI